MNTDECITAHVAYTKEKEQQKQLKEASELKRVHREKTKGKSDYEKDLEKVFNEFIRLRDKDQTCISCDAIAGGYKITAGHYYPAGHYKNIRFDEDNVHGQCWWNCNKNRHGNLHEYKPRLINKIGQLRYNELEQRRLEGAHYSIPQLIEMIVVYKDRVKSLKKK